MNPNVRVNIVNITERSAAEAKIQRHEQLYTALSQCNKAIVHCADEQELFLQICRTAVRFGGMKMAWVGLVDTESRMVRPVASFGDDAGYLRELSISVDADSPFGLGPTGTAIRENRPFWCRDFPNDLLTASWHERAERAGWAASASLPLRREGAVVGAFTLYSGETNAFDESARALLVEMATDISFALDNFAHESQRKRAEEEIKYKNTILLTQQETSLDANLVVDEHGLIISYNQRFIDLWRLSPQLVSAGLDAPVLQSVTDQIENSGAFVARVQYLNAHRDDKSREEISLKDGRIIDRYSAPVRGADGTYYGRVWYFRDITEQKKSEQALRTSEERFKTMFVQAPLGIALTDSLGGHIYEANPRFAEIAGRSMEELAHIDWLQITHPDDVQADLANMTLLNAGKINGFQMEKRYVHPDGKVVWIDMTIAPLKVEDQAHPRHLCMIEDITEHKRLQAQFLQAQKMESVGRLAGGVAHDFNNLLSVILGWTEMAMADLPAEHPTKSSLEEVLSAGHGAARLTKQLLAFSRQQLVEPTVFNANDLVVGMEAMLRPLIGEDIDFATRPAPDLGTVKMDRGQLEQVLMNLAVNARDAMPQGGTLTIETANVELDAEYPRKDADVAPGEYVMIAVSDSGAGMNEDVKTHIFEPFFTTKARGKGTGLGLATCYGIVKQAGGHIAVYSEEGVGTTMKVYMPRRREAAAAAVRAHKKMPLHGVETILLVEDEPAVRRVTARLLEAQGYRVLSTASGEEALRVIEQEREPLHLLLTDVVLAGGMSGRVLADRVHALRPELKVLFASGYTSDVTILHGLLEQSVALVQKPFTAESLGEKVREVLDAG